MPQTSRAAREHDQCQAPVRVDHQCDACRRQEEEQEKHAQFDQKYKAGAPSLAN